MIIAMEIQFRLMNKWVVVLLTSVLIVLGIVEPVETTELVLSSTPVFSKKSFVKK